MSLKIKNRHRLKSKEIKELSNKIENKYDIDFISKNSIIEKGDLEGFNVIIVDDDIDFLKIDDTIVFTLRGLLKHKPKKYVVIVDMGAVGFVVKGADIMSPGIVDADGFIKKDDYVWIYDENNKKPISIGIALISGDEMKNKKSGKAIKNIHYIGDKLWKLSEK